MAIEVVEEASPPAETDPPMSQHAEGDSCSPADEYMELLPPDSDFEVRYTENAGRFLVSSVQMPQGYEFLIESPLAAWPLLPPPSQDSGVTTPFSFCEGCLRHMGDARGSKRKRGEASNGCSSSCQGDMYCSSCADRDLYKSHSFFTPAVFQQWRCWQAARSPASMVGLEAFARCLAQVASRAALIRAAHPGLEPAGALSAARRSFDRLVAPPPGSSVTLHGTSAAEVSAELRGSSEFFSAIKRAVGDDAEAEKLVAESSIDSFAGRLVLNSAGLEILEREACADEEAGVDACETSSSIPAAGVFVLLSMMNHSCSPSVQVSFSESNEVTLRTLRPVEPGEALTISYCATEMPVEDRRHRLRHWFFECDCWRCEAESRLTEALLPGSARDSESPEVGQTGGEK